MPFSIFQLSASTFDSPFHATSVERFARCCNARGEPDEFVMALVRLAVHIIYIYHISYHICNFIICNILPALNWEIWTISQGHILLLLPVWTLSIRIHFGDAEPFSLETPGTKRIKLGRGTMAPFLGVENMGFCDMGFIVPGRYKCTMNSCMTLVKQLVPRILEAMKT